MKKPYAILSISLILGLCVIVAFLLFSINDLKSSNIHVSTQLDEQTVYNENLLVDIKNLENDNQQLKSSLEQLNKSSLVDKGLIEPYYNILLENLDFSRDPDSLRYYPGQEFDGNYKVDHTLSSFKFINSYLDSFRKLTDTVSNTLSYEEKLRIDNLSWDIQTLGIHNHSSTVLVGIRELYYIIKKLDFELAIYKFQLEEITLEELDKKTDEYKRARHEFIEYANSVGYYD